MHTFAHISSIIILLSEGLLYLCQKAVMPCSFHVKPAQKDACRQILLDDFFTLLNKAIAILVTFTSSSKVIP